MRAGRTGAESSWYNIRDFGATGAGDESAVEPLRELVTRCGEAGGGVVYLPPGSYRSGPLRLPDNTTLRIESGATLTFIPRFELYPPVQTRWEGQECYGMHPCIFVSGASNVSIEGGGIIDGSGEPWWEELRRRRAAGETYPKRPQELMLADLNGEVSAANSGGGGREMQFLRPPLIQFFHASRSVVRDVSCQNTPFWNTHIVYSDEVDIDSVTFRSPEDSPNTDGLNIDSSSNVRIRSCHFDLGDDCIGLKSGSGPDGLRVGRPTENVTITGCTMQRGHGGVVIGSETAGGVRNVAVSACVFDGTDRGIRIKSRRGRGGTIESVVFSGISMRNVIAPIVMNLFYRCGSGEGDEELFLDEAKACGPETPAIRNVSISGVVATGVRGAAGVIAGLPESPVRDVSISNVIVSLAPGAREGEPVPATERAHRDAGGTLSEEEVAMVRGIELPTGGGLGVHNCEDLEIRNLVVRSSKGRRLQAEMQRF